MHDVVKQQPSLQSPDEGNDLYRKLIEISPDAIAIHVDGKVVFVNQAGVDLFRADGADQIIGRPILDFVHPDDRAVVLERVKSMRESGLAVPRIEERFVALDGTEIYGDVAAVPFLYRGHPAILVIVRNVTEHRRIEAALARSNDQLEVILQSVDDGITVQDPSGRLVYANEAAARLIGYPSVEALLAAEPEELMERFEVMDDRGAPLSPAELPGRKALAGEPAPDALLGFRIRSTGEQRWSIVKARPVFDKEETVQLAVNVFIDVTASRRMEEERTLRLAQEQEARAQAEAAQQRFAFLAEAGSVLASSLDYETILTSVAHLAVQQIADWCVVDAVNEDGVIERVASAHADPAKELWAHGVEKRYPPDGRSATVIVQETGRSLLVPEVTDDMLVASARGDEEYLGILRQLGMHSLMTVALRARDRVLGSLTFIAAETDRVYGPDDLAFAEELAQRAALAVDNARLYRESTRAVAERETILRHMMDGICLVDPERRVVFANAAARQLLDVSVGAAVGSFSPTFRALTMDGKPYPVEDLPLNRAAKHGETVVDAALRIRHPDGTDRILSVGATPILTEDGEALGALASFRDITEQYQLDRQKDDFLSLVAHELRTPVTVVRGFVQLLGQQMGDKDAATQRRLQTIDRQIMHLTALINDLLDVSRIQTGRLECECAPLEYMALVRSVVDEMSVLNPDRRIHIHAPSSISIVGDAIRLRQVLVNLIDNAFKYGPPGTEVTITVEDERTSVATFVCDEGPPLPLPERERIFDRFYRVPFSPEARAGGLGIGLYISRGIVEAHGGRIWVADEDHSSFAFSLRKPE